MDLEASRLIEWPVTLFVSREEARLLALLHLEAHVERPGLAARGLSIRRLVVLNFSDLVNEHVGWDLGQARTVLSWWLLRGR